MNYQIEKKRWAGRGGAGGELPAGIKPDKKGVSIVHMST